VLALTANPFYNLGGVTPGVGVASVAARLKLSKPFQVGLNTWYFGGGRAAGAILKVRGGVIQEIGLADQRLIKTSAAQLTFLLTVSRS
jgi:hypothetical protein